MQTSHFKRRYFCRICGKAVDLETCKVDGYGMAVHGDCYYRKVAFVCRSTQLVARQTGHRISGLSYVAYDSGVRSSPC